MSKRSGFENQISLFDQEPDFLSELSVQDGWPDQKEFPFNAGKKSVGSVVMADLYASSNPLIVTGYASLEKIIDFCARVDDGVSSVRLLLGSEPYETQRTEFRIDSVTFPDEVKE